MTLSDRRGMQTGVHRATKACHAASVWVLKRSLEPAAVGKRRMGDLNVS